jgi:hypothetical protein
MLLSRPFAATDGNFFMHLAKFLRQPAVDLVVLREVFAVDFDPGLYYRHGIVVLNPLR